MADWWYSVKDKKHGPIGEDVLANLIQAGEIGYQTLLWREGLSFWKPLDEIDELKSLRTAPPPLPVKHSLDPIVAGPWLRYFARTFDGLLEILIILAVTRLIWGPYQIISGPVRHLILVFYLPLSLTLNAAIYKVFGNSPGKSILGAKVVRLDNSPLNFREYLYRNFSLWLKGMALGLPFIYIFAMWYQYRRLKRGESASYDIPRAYKVRAKPLAWGDVVLFVILLLGILVAIAEFTEEVFPHHKTAKSYMPASYQWTNPVTHIAASISSSWESSQTNYSDGLNMYKFSERTGHAMLQFTWEPVRGLTLEQYAEFFMSTTADTMHYWNGGTYDEFAGNKRWRVVGVMDEDKNNRFRFEVIQIGDNFWQILTIQSKPYESFDSTVQKLKDSLWGTVLNIPLIQHQN